MADKSDSATGGVLFKTGIVSAIDVSGKVRVRFEDIGVDSFWLPVCYPKTHQDKFYWIPDMGEQVRCIMDANLEDGTVLGAICSTDDVAVWTSADMIGVRFKDGGEVSYDRGSGKMTINVIGDLDIQVGGKLTIKAAGEADITTAGTTLDSTLRVKQATMLEGGVGGTAGASTPIPGSVKAEHDVVAGDISVRDHHHIDSQGGNTGNAKR